MFSIIPLGPEHLEQMYRIEEACFSVPWSKEMLADDYAKEESVYFAAVEDGELIGYAGMWHIINEGHITNIAVAPEKRRSGAGNALLAALIREAERREMVGLLLEVRVGNYDAQRLYFKNGFILERIRKNYYSDTGEDAYVLFRSIANQE